MYDPSHGVLSDARVTVRNRATSFVRQATSDANGTVHLTSLPPGAYDITTERNGFVTQESTVLLLLGEDRQIAITLALESLHEVVDVGTTAAAIDTSSTTLGRRIAGVEASELPVQGRLFLELAKLTPGILNSYNTEPSGSGFATAGQTGRNNTQLIDGLALDDAQTSTPRGSLPLDAIQDFVVVSNAPTAEYGQASGAIVNVLTKSGTNTFSGVAFVYVQEGAWNAKPGSSVLANPPRPKPDFSQVIVGGSIGGPVSRKRAFFFGSTEYTGRQAEFVVTSPVVRTLAPNEPPTLPQRFRQPQVLGRFDGNLPRSSTIAVRYRLDRTLSMGELFPTDLDYAAPSRAFDGVITDQDVAVLGTFVLSPSLLDELQFQVAGHEIYWDAAAYCAGCASIEYPHLLLGKSPAIPNRRDETRGQVRDALTIHRSGRSGDHTVKAGFDVSFVGVDFDQVVNRDGTFSFSSDVPFDARDAGTYPYRYTRAAGDSLIHVDDTIAAAFVQDRWMPRSGVTLNLGVRWDYEHAIGVSGDTNNVAPRIGVAIDPLRDGRTSFRGSYGVYYDQVWLGGVARTGVQGLTARTVTINSPGYQGDPRYKDDPYGFNPNPARPAPLTNLSRLSDVDTPSSEQATVGFQRVLGSATSLAIDAVWARGQHLLVTHDLNYPTGSPPTRPTPNVGKINTFQSTAHSSYRGIQAGLARSTSRGFGYSMAYTLSTTERDTEDANFVPQNQHDYGADRGPGLNDARHRLACTWTQELPFGLRFATVLTVRSALPYNIVLGLDANNDGNVNDRPPGVSRNPARGTSLVQADLRVTKIFRHAGPRIEFIAEAFNVTNRRNWTYAQAQQFGVALRPSGAAIPRQLQVGLRARL